MSRAAQDDGGPAFPRPPIKVQEYGKTYPEYVSGQTGMSLRDHFAGCALTGLNASGHAHVMGWTPDEFARAAYNLADAMLAERAKEPSHDEA